MKNKQKKYQVAIAGGGPAGLFLACCLHNYGIKCIVLERRKTAVVHSRSIGIHPVSLEEFKKIGLADSFINKGIKVYEGLAFMGSDYIGTLSFASCPPPYPFILTLPQHQTEEILTEYLRAVNPHILWRDTTVTDVTDTGHVVKIEIKRGEQKKKISADYLIGCDGKNSLVRRSADIPFHESSYDDTYIMGDFSDNTSWGSRAAVFLCPNGLIESFPMTNNLRRWVVKTDKYLNRPTRKEIEQRVRGRIGHNLRETKNVMRSSFGVQKGVANSMVKKRVVLAGDAAHLVSPIGGQGMNLGWLDAADLAACLNTIFSNGKRPDKILSSYSRRRLSAAKKVTRRAEFNMALGRKTDHPELKRTLLRIMLTPPFSLLMASLFTMRGLRWLPV